MIDIVIKDLTNRKIANVVNPLIFERPGIDNNGLVVYSEPRRKWRQIPEFFYNSSLGSNLNIDASSSLAPLKIHNGIDDVLWTATNTNRTDFIFDSTTQAHTGTKSIDASKVKATSQCTFTNSTSISMTTYSSITGWIYLGAILSSNLNLLFYNGVTQVGNVVNIGTYINTSLINTWQKFSIIKGDLGISGQDIDRATLTCSASANFYLDDLQLEQLSDSVLGPTEFILPSVPEEVEYVPIIKFSFVGPYDSTLLNNSLPKLSYNKLLNLAELENGIDLVIKSLGVTNIYTFRNLIDFLSYPCTELVDFGGDGTNCWMTLTIKLGDGGLPIIPYYGDKITLVIQDDLSSFLFFKASVLAMRELIL